MENFKETKFAKMVQKHFGGFDMTWVRTLWFSLAVGVFCGIFGGLPALKDTSFTDMAGGYEWWTLFAVVIVVNCKKFWDAGLKCGAFFLITQPLQFFMQAALYHHNFANAWQYTKLWMPVIIATCFGGMIAYFCKEQNVWGAIVMGLGNTIELVMGVSYFLSFLNNPPRHLIAFLVSFISIAVMTLCLQKSTKNRIIAIAIPVVITAILVIYIVKNGLSLVI